jgi:protein TonB
MRKYSLLFSIVAHAAIVGAVCVATIVATDALPMLARRHAFVIVTPSPPPDIAPPVHRPRVPVASPDAAPLVEPQALMPDVPFIPPAGADGQPADSVVAGVPGGFRGPGESAPPPPEPLPPVQPVRVGGAIRPPTKVHHVMPAYPQIARDARKAGIVILEAVVNEDGAVRDVRVLRSEPLLDQAAIDAVKQWRFSPTLLNGQAIPIVMTVTVAFTLH